VKRDVKHHTQALFDERQPSHLPDIPTSEEVQDWNPRRRPACTADNFRPDLNSPPGTPWNKSITAVFVQSFLDADQFECENREKIRRAFVSRLKSLRRAWTLRNTSQDVQQRAAAKARKDERKRNVRSFSPFCKPLTRNQYLSAFSASFDSRAEPRCPSPTC
jgi:hypothetical protein